MPKILRFTSLPWRGWGIHALRNRGALPIEIIVTQRPNATIYFYDAPPHPAAHALSCMHAKI